MSEILESIKEQNSNDVDGEKLANAVNIAPKNFVDHFIMTLPHRTAIFTNILTIMYE